MNIFKTIRNYRIWNKLVTENKTILKEHGFIFNWLNELGIVVKLNKTDLLDLENINIEKRNYVLENLKVNRINETLEQFNSLFLNIGILELINNTSIEIENSQIEEYTYYVTIGFIKDSFSNFILKNITKITIFTILSVIAFCTYIVLTS